MGWQKAIAGIDSLRQVRVKVSEQEQRYYISSHWAIENPLYWVLDVTMRKDVCAIRKDKATEILSLLMKMILKCLRTKISGRKKLILRIRRKRSAWDDDLRAQLLGLNAL